MRVLTATAEFEAVVQKSRFLGLLVPVATPEEARLGLRDAKARFVGATHVVHAFRTGPEGSETLGCSDDGEPSGTAGRPVLDVLKGAGGGNALLLVVRWFGGTKLGTGGLVKAYSETAKGVIAAAAWEEARRWVLAAISVEWGAHRPLTMELASVGAHVESETFDAGVSLVAKIPEKSFEALQTWTVDLTRGQSRWVIQ